MLGGLLFAIIIMRLARPAFIRTGLPSAPFRQRWDVSSVLMRPFGRLQPSAFLLSISWSFVIAALGWRNDPSPPGCSIPAGRRLDNPSFLCAWLVVDRTFGLGAGPDVILAADLLVAGFTTISFGFSLRAR